MITLPDQTAVSVPLPAVGYQRIFLDRADQILKTKDSGGVVRPFGVGTATDLAVTGGGGPVAIDGGPVPAVGYALLATSSNTADWQQLPPASLQSAVQTGALTGDVGTLVRANITGGNATHALPTAVGRTNRQIEYKIIGLASGNTVTITPLALEEIDEVNAPFVMTTDNEYLVLRSNGAGWMVTV
jgi:hypothetical protein